MKRFLRRTAAVVLSVGLLAAGTVFAGAEAADASDTISLGMAALDEASAVRTDTVDGCSVDPDTSDTISLGTATMDASAGVTVLAELTVRTVVQVDTPSGGVDVPLVAAITLAQRTGSTRLTTSVTVRAEDAAYDPLIRSVGVSLNYVNCTESTTPDSGDGFTVCTDSPTGYLSGVCDSNQAFRPGHAIGVTATIDSVILDNGTWSGGPASASRQVTIR